MAGMWSVAPVVSASGRRPAARCLLSAALLIVAAVPAASAQDATLPSDPDSRAAHETERAADTGFVAKARRWAEDTQILERINGEIDGWYPRLGGMTRGSGVTLGPGYRTHILGDQVLADVSAGVSTKGYLAADANLRWLQLFGDRVALWTDLRYEDFPQERFFGRGMDSTRATQTTYAFEAADVALRAIVKPVRWLRFAAIAGYMTPDIGRGHDQEYPSTEQIFADVSAPGLAAQPSYLHSTFLAEVNRLDATGNPRAGGLYRGSFGIWDDRTLNQYDFRRFDLLLTQFVPLTPAKTHVLSGRIGTSYVNNRPGDRVPFYFLPYVGGRDTVRSLQEFRFKDENALWMSVEYRWIPIKWFSVATFTDAGKVSADWQDINLRGLKPAYGFGVRVHSTSQTFATADVATGGGEGWRFFLRLGPEF